jgi:hypothetical protein
LVLLREEFINYAAKMVNEEVITTQRFVRKGDLISPLFSL